MRRRNSRSGLTLVELIVAFTILLILSTMALPLAHVKVQREKERRLRDALTEMRKAIDRYKDMSDEGKLSPADPETHGYPPTLEILVEGVPIQTGGAAGNVFGQPAGQPAGQTANQPNRGPGRSNIGPGSRAGSSQSRTGTFGQPSAGFSGNETGEEKIRFLRRIPVDPMTGTADWGLRSVQDDPDSMSWGGQNVFDVYSKSMDTALDGTRYSEW